MPLSQKVLMGFIFVLLIGLIGGGAFYLGQQNRETMTPTPTPTPTIAVITPTLTLSPTIEVAATPSIKPPLVTPTQTIAPSLTPSPTVKATISRTIVNPNLDGFKLLATSTPTPTTKLLLKITPRQLNP